MKIIFMILTKVFYLLSIVRSESEVALARSNNTEFLLLNCVINDDSCCPDIQEVEYFRNGEGVCTLYDCQGHFVINLTRADTVNYKCGCVESDMKNTYLHVTKSRPTDFGDWNCGCLGKEGGRSCKSGAVVISEDKLRFTKDLAVVSDTCPLTYSAVILLFFGEIIAFAIIFVGVLWILKIHLSRRVTVTEESSLTKLLIRSNNNLNGAEKHLLRNGKIHQTSADMDCLKREMFDTVFRTASDLAYHAWCKLFQPEWCRCGGCQQLKTEDQNVCCKDRGVTVDCFSRSEEFKSKCLEKNEVFAYYKRIHAKKGSVSPTFVQKKYIIPDTWENDPPDKKTSESFRALAYAICKDILPRSDKGVFYPIPSCCKWAIRKVHYDPDYEYLT